MSVSHAQLKAFHAVAVYGSFTRAAERLFLTQPAVSDQVRKLEERYGVLLFHRNKRSVRLSELGERLLAVTQRLFAIEAEAEELLSASSALQTGTLTLAVDAPVHVLPQIARFCERYPGIAVRVETGNTDESLQRLFSYQADLALLGRDVSDERLLSLTLRNDPIVAFVSLSHPWAGAELGRGFAQAKKSPADAGLRSRAGGRSGLLLFLLQGPVQFAAGALDHHLGDRDLPALGVDDGATGVLLRIEGDHAALGGIGVLRIHCPSPHQVYRQSRERR